MLKELKELERQALEQTTSHKVRFICKDKNWNDYIGITNIFPAKDLAKKISMYGGMWADYTYDYKYGTYGCSINNLENGDTILDVHIYAYDPNIIIDDMLKFRKKMWHKCDLQQYLNNGINHIEYLHVMNWDLDKLWDIAKKLDVM